MPDEASARAEALDAVVRSKGLNMIGDLDAPEAEPPLLQLQDHHELVVTVELCGAVRPSKLGSLKGSHEKYEEEFAALEDKLRELEGRGSLRLEKWQPGAAPSSPMPPPPLPSSGGSIEVGVYRLGGRPPRPQSAGSSRAQSRPQSAMTHGQRLRAHLGMADPGARIAPRIGAFEVAFKLVNTTTHRVYGPVEIFSKIATGHWPGHAKLLTKRAQESLQPFLKQDMGDGALFAHVQAQVQQEQQQKREPSTPQLRSAADLPEPTPPPAATPTAGVGA